MVETIPCETTSILEDLKHELAMLRERIAILELVAPAASALAPQAAPAAAVAPKPEPGITQEELLAISAAIAAYLGVRVHIRQIRLISSRAWAQEGRVSIQASHRLHS